MTRVRVFPKNWCRIGAIAGWALVMMTGPAAAKSAGVGATELMVANSEAKPRSALERRLVATRRIGPVVIDGVAGEEAWGEATPQRNFWQRSPDEGMPPNFATEFRVLYDDAAIYVSVDAFDPAPDKIRALLTRRDQDSSSDWISISIDSYADKRTAFMFSLNPAGVQRDVLVFDDVNRDDSWDAVWEGAAAVDDNGWVAEFKIPYSQLRFSVGSQNAWGLQVTRTVQRTRETTTWSPWPQASGREVSLFGKLDGLANVQPPRRLELLPYALAGVAFSEVAVDDPFHDPLDSVWNLGLDLKYGLGSNFTLSGTLLPDFGQVEADPSEVNLSDQESFLEEKRPFFIEGTDMFRFPLDNKEQLFYSRRIGAAPHGALDDADYVDIPDVTRIYGAAKISGKTASGWSVGVLDVVTAKEVARFAETADTSDGTMESDDKAISTQVVEPLTNYSALGVKKDFNGGRTTLGGMVTTVHRALGDESLAPLREELHDQAYAGGLLLNHRFADEAWRLYVKLLGSHVHGTPAAILATQEDSPHYFHRPDAPYLDYDPNRTSLTGMGAVWSAGKMAGDTWRFGTGGDTRSPDLELNDLGFQRQSDYYTQWLWLQRRDDNPGDIFRRWEVNFNAWGKWNYAPDLLYFGGNVHNEAVFANYWDAYLGIAAENGYLQPNVLRGGPTMRGDRTYEGWMGVDTDSRKTVHGEFDSSWWLSPATDSWRVWAQASARVQALSNLDISVGPSLSRFVNDSQYVDQVEDLTTSAPHYILARVDQVTAALTMRLNYTFSPTLSLQVYAQPFVSTGSYTDYKETMAPRAQAYGARSHVFGPDEDVTDALAAADGERIIDRDGDGNEDFRFSLADFSFRELRSNVILRWEYLPGSALFFIWSHGRTNDEGNGQFALDRDLRTLVRETGDHVLLVKLNYWFAP